MKFKYMRFPVVLLLLWTFPRLLSAQVVVKQPEKGRTLEISGPTLICKGGETMLKVEGEYESFQWNTGSTDRILKVKEDGIYEVTVKTKGGCTITGSVHVQVQVCN
jgi:hypothetical protein